MLAIRIATCTQTGARDHNEDDMRYGVADGAAYAVLSDGAGGHDNGAIASDLVVRLVALRLQAAVDVNAVELHEAVLEAHELLLLQQQDAVSERQRMHATMVALWIDAQRGLALWSHVGDSRLYLLRAGRVCHVTRDDSVIRQMIDAGLIDAAAAESHPMKHHLVCAMGVADEFVAHTIERPFALTEGDALLLCSDGWWEPLQAVDIERTLGQAQNPEQWLQAMQVLIAQKANPTQDNYSAIAAWIGRP
ncbi:Protein phosphatase 2C-like:Protein phosphatase 2C-like [Polaromonas sp. CG9_12]|nr:Protein phosphatase 2C-like:Protein phosphatase 2C-like [Polaromonas sp. CG9_12]